MGELEDVAETDEEVPTGVLEEVVTEEEVEVEVEVVTEEEEEEEETDIKLLHFIRHIGQLSTIDNQLLIQVV
jgi:hypothetical protein